MRRRLPVGAELTSATHVSVRIWAPDHTETQVVIDGREEALRPEPGGYFEAHIQGAAGSRYGFKVAGEERLYPDPASRSQPDGPHALSAVIDPHVYRWRDSAWTGVTRTDQVLYELHVGTFTREGTWASAAAHLPRLRELGVTVIQMMPIAEFDGAFGWGYDGVAWFAPSHLYGHPDELRAFVDDAHGLRLGVILDVVYNHLGPSGNYLGCFAKSFVSKRYENEWGDAINFDGPDAEPIRALVLANVEYWVSEFHFDGFRLDATQQIFDASPVHILEAVSRRARASTNRGLLITGENEPQHACLMRSPEKGGYGLDALYNDDFHHSARVALTGVREAYYTDYEGSSRELLAAVRWGFLFQGQHYSWQKDARGTPTLDCDPDQFVCFLENHDQVANSVAGTRLNALAHPGDLRALTALLLLMPATPLLFQGQEWGSTAPWTYFAAHGEPLGDMVRKGRLEFMSQFKRFATPDAARWQPDPTARETFDACRLNHQLDERGERFWRFHQDLLTLRRTDAVFARVPRHRPEGATLNDGAFVLRYTRDTGTRLLVINLGNDVMLARMAEPLVAPPERATWSVVWSSEWPAYGGGMPELDAGHWMIPGHAAVVLAAVTISDGSDSER